jgi:hypothetical protein
MSADHNGPSRAQRVDYRGVIDLVEMDHIRTCSQSLSESTLYWLIAGK